MLSEYIVTGNNGIVKWKDSFGALNLTWDPVRIIEVPGAENRKTFVSYYQVVYGKNINAVKMLAKCYWDPFKSNAKDIYI